jgi:hypothetical protein
MHYLFAQKVSDREVYINNALLKNGFCNNALLMHYFSLMH